MVWVKPSAQHGLTNDCCCYSFTITCPWTYAKDCFPVGKRLGSDLTVWPRIPSQMLQLLQMTHIYAHRQNSCPTVGVTTPITRRYRVFASKS